MALNGVAAYRAALRERLSNALAAAGEAAAAQARQAVPLGDGRDGGHLRARPYLLPALRAQAAGFLQAIRK